MSEPYEDEDDPFALDWDRPPWANRLTWVLLAAVVAALAFAGGLLIERQYDSTALTAARSGARTGGGGLAVAGIGGGARGGGAARSAGAAAGSGGADAAAPRAGGDGSAAAGEIAGGGAMAHPVIILTGTYVENPMQGVLDTPVPADGSTQDSRIIVAAGEEVALPLRA